ncbi:hypothetical protein NMY22_g9320 [Coprinellus aureogranulatus]|nr:hypothetical protein NMY22_g9320 [Coprinellus aureogranulatus]
MLGDRRNLGWRRMGACLILSYLWGFVSRISLPRPDAEWRFCSCFATSTTATPPGIFGLLDPSKAQTTHHPQLFARLRKASSSRRPSTVIPRSSFGSLSYLLSRQASDAQKPQVHLPSSGNILALELRPALIGYVGPNASSAWVHDELTREMGGGSRLGCVVEAEH